MAASRLFQFSKILNVPISYFFEDMPEEALSDMTPPGMGENEQAALENVPQADKEMLNRRETLELIRAYYRITDVKQRRKIYELIKAMAD